MASKVWSTTLYWPFCCVEACRRPAAAERRPTNVCTPQRAAPSIFLSAKPEQKNWVKHWSTLKSRRATWFNFSECKTSQRVAQTVGCRGESSYLGALEVTGPYSSSKRHQRTPEGQPSVLCSAVRWRQTHDKACLHSRQRVVHNVINRRSPTRPGKVHQSHLGPKFVHRFPKNLGFSVPRL